RGQRGDGDGGRVAGDDDVVAKKMAAFSKHVALELELFGHGFDNKTGIRDGGHVRNGNKASEHSSLLRRLELALLDFAVEIFRNGIDGAVEEALLDVAQQDVIASAREDVCDAVAHGTGA